MKTKHLLAGLLFATASALATSASAQVKIGTDPTNIDESAILHLESGNKGFLPPRVSLQSLSDGATITNPASGLVIYNTNTSLNGGVGIYINTGTKASPVWGKLEATTATTGGSVSKLIYPGVVDPGKTFVSGMFEFRYVASPGVAGGYDIQMRLTSPPVNPVNVRGQRLGWDINNNVISFGVNRNWTTVDWNTWQSIDGTIANESHSYTLAVTGSDQFYRVTTSVQPGQFALLVEKF